MKRRFLLLPVAALSVAAAYLGWNLSVPMSDTQIIEFYAAKYVSAHPGVGRPEDCEARRVSDMMGADDYVLVIDCSGADAQSTFIVNRNGREIDAPNLVAGDRAT